MKQTLTLFASLLLALAIPHSVKAYDFSYTYQGKTLYYTITGSNTVSVVNPIPPYWYGFTGTRPSGDVIIPSSVQNNSTTYTVTGIGEYAFSYCSVTSVTIPSSITSIGERIFYSCNNITTLNYNATNCTSLPSNENAFGYCPSLTTINIGGNVTHLPDYLFSCCEGITSITIPASVTNIGNRVFYDCSGLTTVYFNATNCASMNGTSSESVFFGCHITTLNIGSTVEQIPNKAFRKCTELTTVNFNATNCTSMGSWSDNAVFYDCPNLATVNIGNNVTQLPADAFYNCTGLTSVSISSSVITSIGNSAFRGCSSLTSITIPNSITSICVNAFYGCTSLISITIPNSVTSIGSGAFYGCSGLTSVTIPNSVTSIDQSTFSGCTGLTSVTIGNSVTSIGSSAFQGCTGLTSVTIPNSVTSIGSSAFQGCTGLTSVTIPNSVTSIGSNAFRGCPGLTSVTIPNSVTSIGQRAFSECSGLISVTIPNSVTSISNYTFYGCSSLTSVTIPDGVTSIGNEAFYNCSGLDTVYMKSEIAPSLGSNCFSYNATGRVFMIPCGSYDSYYNKSQWSAYRNYLREPVVDLSISVASSSPYYGSASVVPFRGNNVHCDSTTIVYATADEHCVFDHWSNGNTANPDTLHLTGDSTVTAVFIPNQYTVTGVASDNIKGTVYGSATVYYLDTVTLTATANYGYHYTGWNDNNNDNPRRVVATGNITLSALFDYNQYSITVQADTSIHGNCAGGGSYNYLSERTITATANYGYHFTQWNDGNTDNPRVITLTKDTAFIALFAKNQYIVNGLANYDTRGSVLGSDTVDYLDTVTLTAMANYGYHFVKWNDNNTHNPRRIAATGNITKTAIFEYNKYSLTVQADISIHGTCTGSGNYNYLSERTISATANYGYHFSQWDDGNTDNPRTITLTQDTTFIASFAPNQYTLTVTAGEHGTASGSGSYDYGDTIMIQAYPEAHYHFIRWNDGNADNPRQYRVGGDITLTAFFAIDTYTVNVVPSDPVRGMVTQSGTEFEYLSPCTVEATAYTGYMFAGWSNGVTSNPYTFAVQSDVELTAIFVAEGEEVYTVTVVSADPTMGTVSGGGQALSGGTVTFSATPNEGYRFLYWNDGNTENPRTVTVTANATYTATFEAIAPTQYTITVMSNNDAWGTVSGGGIYNEGTEVNIVATPADGYRFVRWNDGNTQNPLSITVTSNATYIATFEENGGTEGIDEADGQSVTIYASEGRIHVYAAQPTEAAIYDMIGRHVATVATGASTPMPAGVYLVKVGTLPARKVVVIK